MYSALQMQKRLQQHGTVRLLLKKTPTALVLTRQNLPQLAGTGRDAVKGAYIVADSAKETPDAIIIATGSELSLAVEAKELLLKDGMDVRVVSMPCMDLFEEQSPEYKESVLPKAVRKRVAVEALSDFGWGRYVGLDGATVCMEGFGASGPAAQSCLRSLDLPQSVLLRL